MSDPFASLQPDSGHVLEKIITKIGTIITKKIRFQFLGSPLLWQVVNQMVSKVHIFFFTEIEKKTKTLHFSFGIGLGEEQENWEWKVTSHPPR